MKDKIKTLKITLLCVLLRITLSSQQQTCGNLNINDFYNDEKQTALSEHPWMGLIFYNDPDNQESSGYKCLGVLITKRHLISPAHCVTNKFEAYSVVLGDWNAKNDISEIDCHTNGECARLQPAEYEIEEIAINPNFKKRGGSDNDIAILTLAKEVTVNDYVEPICIFPPSTPAASYVSQYLNVVGYPVRQLSNSTLSVRLKALAHIASSKRCSDIYVSVKVSENQICGHVNGDEILMSGSALMGVITINDRPDFYYLIGIATFGSRAKSYSLPDMFMRVEPYKDWILRNSS